jgi:3-polyprenyl-4-hydroxybenzoate decarboxylase
MTPSEYQVFKALHALQRSNLQSSLMGTPNESEAMVSILARELHLPMCQPAEIRDFATMKEELAQLLAIVMLNQNNGLFTLAEAVRTRMNRLCAWWLFGVWDDEKPTEVPR